MSWSAPRAPLLSAAVAGRHHRGRRVLWLEIVVLLTAANLIPRLPLGWAIPAGVAVVLLMGLRMNAFGVILHEGSHGLLAKSRTPQRSAVQLGGGLLDDQLGGGVPADPPAPPSLPGTGTGSRSDLLPGAGPAGGTHDLLLQDLFGVTAFRRATTRISGTSQESERTGQPAGPAPAAHREVRHPGGRTGSVHPVPGWPAGVLSTWSSGWCRSCACTR